MPPKSRASKPPRQRDTIPLICTLCPKNPNFSDTSHLLTHISSKSHLAARFKLQIRSQSEQEARDILDNFDAWYQDNNLDTLLSDRLAIKEQKKAAKERKNNEHRGLVPVLSSFLAWIPVTDFRRFTGEKGPGEKERACKT
jgi:hypothetical protein